MPGSLRLDYQMACWGSPQWRPFVMIEIACDGRGHSRHLPVTLPALLDTGADRCSIPKSYADACGHVYKRGRPIKMDGTTGKDEVRLHASVLRFTGPGVRVGRDRVDDESFIPWSWSGDVCVCRRLRDFALLGLQDFLYHWNLDISRRSKTFRLTPASDATAKSIRGWRR